jgi:hypothetical protein
MATALQMVTSGRKVSAAQARKAADQAVKALSNSKKAAARARAASKSAMAAVQHEALTLGAIGATSALVGYVGDQRAKVYGTDLRLVVGGLGLVGGAAMAFGSHKAAGYTLAVSNGVLGSGIADLAKQMGAQMAKPAVATAGIHGVREVLQMTDDPVAPMPATSGRRHAMAGRRRRR